MGTERKDNTEDDPCDDWSDRPLPKQESRDGQG